MKTNCLIDGTSDYYNARAMAVSAGDMSITVREEVERIFKDNKNKITKSLNAGLEELLEREIISDKELKILQRIARHFLRSLKAKEDEDVEDAYFAIKKLYNNLLLDQHASPVAIAIASVTSSTFSFKKSNSVKVEITPMSTGAGAVIGSIIGGVVGFIASGGNPLGAAAGAGVGAAAGGAIGFCNENNI